jgi:hypothetical protein
MADQLLKDFNLEREILDAALDHARWCVSQGDKTGALSSIGDAQVSLERIEEMLED